MEMEAEPVVKMSAASARARFEQIDIGTRDLQRRLAKAEARGVLQQICGGIFLGVGGLWMLVLTLWSMSPAREAAAGALDFKVLRVETLEADQIVAGTAAANVFQAISPDPSLKSWAAFGFRGVTSGGARVAFQKPRLVMYDDNTQRLCVEGSSPAIASPPRVLTAEAPPPPVDVPPRAVAVIPVPAPAAAVPYGRPGDYGLAPAPSPAPAAAAGGSDFVGPRGGVYHYSSSGKKVYSRKR